MSWRRAARPILIVLAIGLFLAILGAFGSDSMGWPWVWLYWTGFIGLGAGFGFAAAHLTERFAPGLPIWAPHAVAAVTLSVPVTFAVWTVNAWVGQRRLDIADLPVTFVFVFVIAAFVSGVVFLVERVSLRGREADAAPPRRAGTALLDKLPVRLRAAEIWALEAEDHYLRVHTDRGDALVLMRLTDAVAACEGLDGARTHRSWWVARAGVADARKGDGRGVLILNDGKQAPVSRTFYAALREAGWF